MIAAGASVGDAPICPPNTLRPDVHPITDLVLQSIVEKAGVLVIEDAALLVIANAYGDELRADRAAPATEALLATAMFLELEKKSPHAANTLVTLCLAAAPMLRSLGDDRATKVAAAVDATKARFAHFKGDERVASVLDSGLRPAGTVPASPFARFQMAILPKKP